MLKPKDYVLLQSQSARASRPGRRAIGDDRKANWYILTAGSLDGIKKFGDENLGLTAQLANNGHTVRADCALTFRPGGPAVFIVPNVASHLHVEAFVFLSVTRSRCALILELILDRCWLGVRPIPFRLDSASITAGQGCLDVQRGWAARRFL